MSTDQELKPAVIQDAITGQVLMLGYMNLEAREKTVATGKVTFFSRSKGRLWMKGETSGNVLEVVELFDDCDNDAILVRAKPHGPTCHNGTRSCFGDPASTQLDVLERTIAERVSSSSTESYVASLVKSGVGRLAQKVGEEGVEVALAAVSQPDDVLIEEATDLLFHLMVLLQSKGKGYRELFQNLDKRSQRAR